MLGCDLSQLDTFTLSLITNAEVIDINQDALGIQGTIIGKEDLKEVYAKKLFDGSYAVGLFNKGLEPAVIKVSFSDLDIHGQVNVRDVWRQLDIGTFTDNYSARVPPHGVLLLKLTEQQTK